MDRDLKVALFGVVVGSTYTYMLMRISKQKVVVRMLDDINLRSELLNWITQEGIYLTNEEFFDQFHEKATFINIVGI